MPAWLRDGELPVGSTSGWAQLLSHQARFPSCPISYFSINAKLKGVFACCCLLACSVCLCGWVWVVFFFFKLEAFEGNGGKNWKLKNWKHSAPHVLLVLLLRESRVTLKERSLELPMKMAACRKRRAWPCVYFPKWLLMPEANCMQPKPRARHVWPQ